MIERNRNEAIRFRLKYDLRKCSYEYSEIYQDILKGISIPCLSSE